MCVLTSILPRLPLSLQCVYSEQRWWWLLLVVPRLSSNRLSSIMMFKIQTKAEIITHWHWRPRRQSLDSVSGGVRSWGWGGLTWLIGAKSTGALSAGHISSNQQDDASRAGRIGALLSHYVNIRLSQTPGFTLPPWLLFTRLSKCFFKLGWGTCISFYMNKTTFFWKSHFRSDSENRQGINCSSPVCTEYVLFQFDFLI